MNTTWTLKDLTHVAICDLHARGYMTTCCPIVCDPDGTKGGAFSVTHPSINLQDYNWSIAGCRHGPFYHTDKHAGPIVYQSTQLSIGTGLASLAFEYFPDLFVHSD